MIKKLPKYIFSYLFCLYFVGAGAGFNVISYCCENCAIEGIESVATSSCFAVHHHDHTKQCTNHDDLVCNDLNHQPDNCHLYRISTDTPSNHTVSSLLHKQLAAADLIILKVLYTSCNSEPLVWENNPPPDITCVQTGRAILTRKSVLII
jgi:hypothetical protein